MIISGRLGLAAGAKFEDAMNNSWNRNSKDLQGPGTNNQRNQYLAFVKDEYTGTHKTFAI